MRVIVPALADRNDIAVLTLTDASGEPFIPVHAGSSWTPWRVHRGEVDLFLLPPRAWKLRVEGPDGATWIGAATTRVGEPTEVVLE